MTKSQLQRFQDLLIITIFISLISLPMIGNLFKIELVHVSENRALARIPSLNLPLSELQENPLDLSAWWQVVASVARYPRAFQSFYSDNFGFRQLLIRLHSYLVIYGFPSHSDALIGKDNWLFYGEAQALASYRRTDGFTTEELENWRQELELRRDWLAAQGIHYLFVIAPEKSTIYPEYMPTNITRAASASRLDQFLRYMEQNSDIEIVDLRPDLLQQEQEQPLYFRTDTHWNDLGAFAGYSAIVSRLKKWFPQMIPVSASDFKIEIEKFSGDLAGILALNDVLLEEAPFMVPIAPLRAHPASPKLELLSNVMEWQQPMATEVDEPTLPTAMVFRDSFGERLAPFLAENFRRVLTISDYSLDQATILREKPDVVIQEMVERILYFPEPPGRMTER